jgi:lycopene cyclase CruP
MSNQQSIINNERLTEKILGSRNDNILEKLRQADRFWSDLKQDKLLVSEVIRENSEILSSVDRDIIISGGTLGILLAAALQKLGWRVTVIERGILQGREQEWNISRQELSVFIELELLTEAELEKVIVTEYNPARVGFAGGKDIWVNDVLNIGVDPIYLLATLKQKFLESGGHLLENTSFKTATVHPNGVSISTGETQLTTRLLIDAMGHFSPIVRQLRKGKKPDAVCVVVGSCASGYSQNNTGDLIYSFTPIIDRCQYFWEAFPAKDGRTTYMFSYLDAHPQRPSLEYFMEEYLRLLPEYQKIELERLTFNRFLFGFFPAYRDSPLTISFDRLLLIGDSAGLQSPVSFGGFGSMVRHLKRLTNGINEALEIDNLKHKDLALLQPYQPNISLTWLFQKTMSVRMDKNPNPDRINNLMNGVFVVMNRLGDPVIKPFLQDAIQLLPLTKTLPLVNPKLVLPMLPEIGLKSLINWSLDYFNLFLYTILNFLGQLGKPLIKNSTPHLQYYYHRWLDAWKYGSGADYHRSEIVKK